jgi:hypothetical protein
MVDPPFSCGPIGSIPCCELITKRKIDLHVVVVNDSGNSYTTGNAYFFRKANEVTYFWSGSCLIHPKNVHITRLFEFRAKGKIHRPSTASSIRDG